MKKTLLCIATAVALTMAAPLAAQDHDRCLDGCDVRVLFDDNVPGGGDAIPARQLGAWGIDTAGMDTGVDPGEDFFAYVSGNWAETTEIPSDRSSYGAFAVLRDLSEARLRKLVESYPAGDPATGGDAAKIAALYQGYMDEAAVEALGAKPLAPHLDAIRSVADKDAMAALMGQRNGGFCGTFFGAYVSDDQRNPDTYALYLSQSGLGLGDREMYLDEKFAPQRERYQAYIAQMLELAGCADPQANAEKVVAMETRIAQAHWTRAESRNRDKTYNPVELDQMDAQAPGFPWATFFAAAGVDQAERAVVRQVTAFPQMARIFADTDLDTLKAWQAFQTVDNAAPLLSKAFVDAEFEFRSKFMSGQPEQRPRWKRGVAFAENAMGESIGRDYVELYFPADAKAKMDELVANVKAAMRVRLGQLEWMGADTRTEALAKLENFGLKIGHPDEWRDYSGLQVVAGDLFGNAQRSRQFEWDYNRKRIGQPVDKGEWGMTPQTVNAYYSSVKNEIVFPAAILQPPFFDPDADPAVNYGAIGGVIGHEIIHGFDDQGRKSDGDGNLRDWWTAEDAQKFEQRATKLGAQYESFEFSPAPGSHIIARLTMGENIADLGGVLLALDAYHRHLNGSPAPALDGFTGDQRVFLGWAQVWRSLIRDAALKQQLATDPHSPGTVRAFAPLRNVDAWYDAFDVKPGDKNYVEPEERARIW